MGLRPFYYSDLDRLRLSDGVRDEISAFDARCILTALSKIGLAFTMVGAGGVLLGVAGVVPHEEKGESTGGVFVVAAEDRKTHGVEFARLTRKILGQAKSRFAKIEAEQSPWVSDRWFEWLGFERNPMTGRWQMDGEA